MSVREIVHVCLAALALTVSCQPSRAVTGDARTAQSVSRSDAALLDERIRRILDRAEFRHSQFGVDILSLDTGRHMYQLNADKLFAAGSTAKLLTAATALDVLGEDFRLHTLVYGSGPILKDGTLDGDLVFVASGDPNLSARVRADGTLAFQDRDHDYSGPPVPGDPLTVMRKLAEQVASQGIKRVRGDVVLDVRAFPEREISGYVVSPVVVNDNIIDITIRPGPREGSPAIVTQSPASSYLKLSNDTTTATADSKPSVDWASDIVDADGTHEVTVKGTIPAGAPPVHLPYTVREPTRFAERVFVQALAEKGVTVNSKGRGSPPNFDVLSASYVPERLIARHVSPALSEEVKLTLKVSQNLHASMMSVIVAAQLGKEGQRTGIDFEREFLDRLGVDRSGAQKSDAAGADTHFPPAFMVAFLSKMAAHRSGQCFESALPVLGRDGTLANVQPESPAAGHVFAKTGTFGIPDALNRRLLIVSKALAGYMTTASGEHLAFAIYVHNVPIAHWGELGKVGQALGEIAAVAYETVR